MHEHIRKRIETIISDIKQLPSIPEVASRVLTLVNDPNVSFKQVGEEIAKDQAISANILKLCNSAFFSKGKEITSIERAIVTLGTKEVKDIVVIATTRELLNKAVTGYDLTRGELWKHALAVAMVSKKIAVMKNKKDIADIAFTGGILHDVGKTVLALFVQGSFKDIMAAASEKQIPFSEAEKDIMGFDHQEIGEAILSKWKFPEVLKVIVRYHHTPELAKPEFQPIVSIVHIANTLCLMAGIGIGSDGLFHSLSDQAIKVTGVSNADMEQIYSDLPQTISQATEFM
jgi:putative nucleotidyltransferase with HDIG domain